MPGIIHAAGGGLKFDGAEQRLAAIRTDHGTYAVPGRHDEYEEEFRMERSGILVVS